MKKILQSIREDGQYHLGKYGTLLYRVTIEPWDWSIALCRFHSHWAFHFLCIWIKLWHDDGDFEGIMQSWGFSYLDCSLHLKWGSKYKIIYMPWMWMHYKTELMLNRGGFVNEKTYEELKEFFFAGDPLYKETFDYTYKLSSGEDQIVKATVTVRRYTWVWRWFRWLGWPKNVEKSIWVEFNEEVGEQTGSWKGGVLGCGCDMRDNESPEQTLRRMEKERKFT